MANDITGSDTRCPKCKIGYTQPEILNGKIFFICCCGYGKDEYFKELEKQQKTKKIIYCIIN